MQKKIALTTGISSDQCRIKIKRINAVFVSAKKIYINKMEDSLKNNIQYAFETFKMEDSLKNNIQHAFETLMNAEKEFYKKKCQILINAFEQLNFKPSIINALKEKGLPKIIVVSTHWSDQLKNQLSWFAEVKTTTLFPDFSMMLSWTELDFNKNFPPVYSLRYD